MARGKNDEDTRIYYEQQRENGKGYILKCSKNSFTILNILIRRYFTDENNRQKHIGKNDEKCSKEIGAGSRRQQMYVYLPPAQAAGRTEKDKEVNRMVQ